MTLARACVAFIVAAVVAGALPDAGAQSPFDSWRARRAQRPPAPATAPSDSEPAGIEGVEAAGGKFALPPGVRVERDVGYGSDAAQKLDAYIPQGATGAPIIVMVHGGAWMLGDKGNSGVVANKVKHWVPKGYIVVSTNYRMGRPPNAVQQADDVARALAFVQERAAAWGGDAARVVLMGHSSGAHLVALLTSSPTLAARAAARPWLGTVSLDSAALDVPAIMRSPHPRLYDRVFGTDPARWNEASPLHQLVTRPVPLLLVCSSRRSDSCAAAQRLAARARELGGRASVLPIDLAHGEINGDLGRSAEGYTASVDDFLRSLALP